eukprot:TRINITY_DN2787_c0_g1_i1.p1 TRINITY_DN2787_c0_g1~~TRINITY_DN2787_c0_g1_i1.p1  ORF type:complete len:213 (-),score=108.71 TRINITY_DN2787_c0_g1_i1:149-766(-)
MSKKKAVSHDEKLKRLEELFHETKEVYTLKQLEKLAPKSKGIIVQAVKDILDELVADDLVCMDKVGLSNYFWSFPSQSLALRTNKIATLDAEIATLQARKDALLGSKAEASAGKEESDDRTQQLLILEELEKNNVELKRKIAEYAAMDPDVMEDMRLDTKEAIEAANRWTDNVYILKKYCTTNFGIDSESFDRQFEVPSDFDSIA